MRLIALFFFITNLKPFVMGSTKAKIKVKVTPSRKPIKPSLGKGTGGVFTARILAEAKKKKNK